VLFCNPRRRKTPCRHAPVVRTITRTSLASMGCAIALGDAGNDRSPLMALRFPRRLMVIQSAFPRFQVDAVGVGHCHASCCSIFHGPRVRDARMAALLTMRVQGPILRSAKGSRKSRPDDKLRAVSKMKPAPKWGNGFFLRQVARPIKVSKSPSERLSSPDIACYGSRAPNGATARPSTR